MSKSVALARFLHENACWQTSSLSRRVSQVARKHYSPSGLSENSSTISSASTAGTTIAEEARLKSLADLRRKFGRQTSDLRKRCALDIQEKRLLMCSTQVNNRVHARQLRSFSSAVETGGLRPLDQETEEKAGWLLKAFIAVTFTYVGFNVFPLMGDSLVTHSVALLRTKDPLFRRSGASRLTLIATDDERRLKIVDAGGVGALVNMLQSASDDDDATRREAAKALATLSKCDAAVEALHKTGVQPFVNSLSTASSDEETQQHSVFLLERLKEWRTRMSK